MTNNLIITVMTIKFIKMQLLKAGYYCDRNPRNRVVRVWTTDNGTVCPPIFHIEDYMCFSSYAVAFRTIVVRHITF